jgi:hypothetical protein
MPHNLRGSESAVTKDQLEFLILLASIATTIWIILRYLLKPFAIWAFTELGREAFKAEFDSATHVKEEMETLRLEFAGIKQDTSRTADACERMEKTVERLADNVMELTKAVSVVQGAQQSLHGGYKK